jgi:branched-chain amino acid transport system substrate-binding protein
LILRRLRLPLAIAALAAAAVLSGCGDGAPAVGNKIHGQRLTIYASVPLQGASSVSAQAVVDGAQLALDSIHARIGAYRIRLRELDDATAQSDRWDPGQTTLDVHEAMVDPTTIGYIGDFNSGATAVSIPLLNRDDIPQISPSSTAVGLTQGGLEASPGEPLKYYPTGRRTFVRVVPNDSVQAVVLARLMRSVGCTKTYLLDDGEVDGEDIAASLQVAAKAAKLNVVGSQGYERKATDYTSLATGVAQTHANCVFVGAIPEDNAVLLTRQIAAALPEAKIFGPASLAQTTYVNPGQGGIPLSIDPRVLITVAAFDPASYPPAGRAFLALYQRRFGPPEPYAIYGYEAMSLMLDAISRATDHGTLPVLRSQVLQALFATRDRHSVLGTYSINSDGDTSLDRYGVWRVVDGRLAFWKAITG